MIAAGLEPGLRFAVNSVMWPAVSMRPMAGVVPSSVNQRLPSGPAVMCEGRLPGLRPVVNLVIVPAVVMRPIAPALVFPSANQRL